MRLADGLVIEDPDSIGKEAMSFFENLWKKNGIAQPGVQVELLELIPPLVSREDNSMLEELVSLKEVKAAVFGLGGEKAPGPDGFQAFFFQSFWEVLGEELLAVVEESRSRCFFLKEFNCMMVALIP